MTDENHLPTPAQAAPDTLKEPDMNTETHTELPEFESTPVTVTIFASGDNENTPEEAVHHALSYAHKAGFIEGWTDPVVAPIKRGNYEDSHPNDEVLWSASDLQDHIDVVAELGLEDSHIAPAEAVRELKAELEHALAQAAVTSHDALVAALWECQKLLAILARLFSKIDQQGLASREPRPAGGGEDEK